MSPSTKRVSLAVAVAVAVVGAGAVVWLRTGASEALQPETAKGEQGASAAAPGATRIDAGPAALPSSSPPTSAAALAAAHPASPRQMAYRPASYLYYSAGSPAKDPRGDDDQPALRRIFDVTQADGAQQALLRAAWRTHEDARRVLWAEAYPRVSGPRMLDPAKLEALDAAFESAALNLLRPDQGERLSQEVPPPGTSRTPPPEMYKDPANQQ